MKILFHAINGVGLGHINRTLVLAKTIRKINPKAEILFMSSTEFKHIFHKHGFDYVKCPYLNHDNFFDKKDNDSITKIIEKYKPDICVWDTHPPPLVLSDKRDTNIKNILILRRLKDDFLRDFLDSPQAQLFSKILIPHTIEEFEHYNTAAGLMKKIKYSPNTFFTGPLVKEMDKNKVNKVKKRYGINNNDYVILAISGGGGQYPNTTATDDFFENCIKSFEDIYNEIKNPKFIIINGPLCKKKPNSKNPNIIIKDYEDDLMELMSGSNLIISRAGYNSVNEIMSTGTPAILMDIPCDYDDQIARAKYLEKLTNSVYLDKYSLLKNKILDMHKNKIEKSYAKINSGNQMAALEILRLYREMQKIKNNHFYLTLNFNQNETIDSLYNKAILLLDSIKSNQDNNKTLQFTDSDFPDSFLDEIPAKVFDYSKEEFFELLHFNAKILKFCIQTNFCFPWQTFKNNEYEKMWFNSINDFSGFMYYIYKKCGSLNSIIGIHKSILEEYPKIKIEQTVTAISVLSIFRVIRSYNGIAPSEITISLTNRCNLKCKMCDIWESNPKKDLEMKHIKKIVHAAKKQKINCISLTGGEIFLRDDLNDIYRLIRHNLPKTHINFSTNGFATDKIRDFIGNIKNQNTSFTISIDGISMHDSQRGARGSFENSKKTITLLKESNIPVEIKLTITPNNYKQILEVYSFAKELGIKFQLKPVMYDKNYTNKIMSEQSPIFQFKKPEITLIKRQINQILNDKSIISLDRDFIKLIPDYLEGKKPDFKCECPKKSIFIMEDTKVFSCLQTDEIGNLENNEFDELLVSERSKNIITNRFKKCSDCLSYYGSAPSVLPKNKTIDISKSIDDFNVLLISPMFSNTFNKIRTNTD
ncbi:hypothetical protein CMO94_01500 [Candidatus Woesearchaeota archaeon]|nr:hypothetical protein [Candidatus Woesearchaeota archaeon]